MLGLGLSIPRCAVRAGDALTREVASILAKYGTDAHVYLPGIGVINGLTAGNYLDSAGTTAATVDNPVGLVLDGAGSVGSELITNGDFSNGATGWSLGSGWTVSSGALQATSVTNFQAIQILSISANKTYKVTLTISNYVSGAFKFSLGMSYDTTYADISGNGTYTFYRVAKATDTNLYIYPTGGFTGSIDNISVKEVTGIHATQSTTANKPVLRQTSGRYWWDMVDGTDLLTTTYPAGYESVITIDAPSTGQVTLTAQNIVGTYNITTDTYGRFVFKTLTAGELAIMQTFANRLAGL